MICKGYDFPHFFKGSVKEYAGIIESSPPHWLLCSRYLVLDKSRTPNSTSPPVPHRRAPNTPAQDSKGLANCSRCRSRKHYCSANTALSLAQKVGPTHRVGSRSSSRQARGVLPKSRHKRRATEGRREGPRQQ